MSKKNEVANISRMACDDRFLHAKRITNENIDTILNLIGIYYARREAFGENSFASKLPRSRAAGTFNSIMLRLSHSQCIELCRFWDKPEENGKSFPTVLEYCRSTNIEERLRFTAEQSYSEDSEMAEEYHQRLLQRFKTAERLINKSNTDIRLRRTKNFRDRIAHNLLSTRTDTRLLEKGEKPLDPPSSLTLKALGIRTIWVSWLLHSSLNNTDFDFKHSIRIYQKRSLDFWGSLENSINPRSM